MKTHLVLLLAAASSASILAQSASPHEQTVKLAHVDLRALDSTVNPCDDFYQYVCAKPNAANPIPPDQVFWGSFGMIAEWNRQVLHQILEENSNPAASRTPNEQKIGDLYASCMAQATSGADDLRALDPLLSRISAMKNKRDIAPVLALIHRSFGTAWQGDNSETRVAMFGFGSQPDFNNVNQVVAGVDQGGLGMPDREFYLREDPNSKAIREKYVALIVKFLELSGTTGADASKDATTIMRLETAMAKAQMDDVDRRDPNKINNRYTLATLHTLMPAFDWDVYLDDLGAPAVPVYEVSAPAYFQTLNNLLQSESLETWKVYLRWQLLRAAGPTLGKSWRDANFTVESALTGRKVQEPDWRRCTESVDSHIGEALGQVYVKRVFPPEEKARVLKMVENIEAAMGRDIDAISWMQPATKRQARLKLAAMINKIGYPDKWIDYSSLSITRNSYPANIERATAFELKRQLSFIGKPLDRTQWFMTPPTANAYEDPQSNTINFPAGMLQPPYFDPKADAVINYGTEGSVMGHELTHGFDDQGRKFDAQGNLKDWWTAKDAMQYDQRGQCIAKEYSGPVPGVPGVQQNGKLTQGENTADNGGIYLALSALKAELEKQGTTLQATDDLGFTNLQRFFIAYASDSCVQIQPQLERTLVLTDPHSLPELRVNNVVSNMPEFQEAFKCKAGQPMVHATQCRVW